MITLANGTGGGVFAAPKRLPRAEARAAAAQAPGALPDLHHELAFAAQAHRNAQLQELNGQLTTAGVRARVELAAAEQARQQQAAFLAVVAHELRNPLTPIRTAAEMLGRIAPGDGDGLARLGAIIERQVVHISRLIDDLLDLSRARTGKLRLECTVVDLLGIVDQAVEACRATMQKRGHRLVVVAPTHPLEVDGDPVRLTQVLGNLLDNACKYTPEGGTIELLAAAAGDLVVMSVSDTGIGITAETLPHVFEPFAQGQRADGVGAGGLGLGLAVVRELIDAHGGSVAAHSSGRGNGSLFVVTLPRSGAAAAFDVGADPDQRAVP